MTDMTLFYPLGISRFKRSRRQRRSMKRWIVWGIAAGMFPAIGFAAYQPAFMIGGNNLSEITSASSARTNLGLGTIATQAANNVAVTGGAIDGTTLGATTRSSVKGTTGDFNSTLTTNVTGSTQCVHANSSGVLSGASADCAVAPSITIYVSNTTPVTLANTNGLTEVIAQAAPAALTINLNATGLTAGYTQCVKDKSNTFATNNATVKTTDSSTIDSVAGSTGYVMNQTKQANCFVFDGGTNWIIM